MCSAAHAAPLDVASAFRFVIFDAEGFKWFEVAPGGGAGKLRDAVAWMHVRRGTIPDCGLHYDE